MGGRGGVRFLNFVLLGCESAFTAVVLDGLLRAGLTPSRLGLYGHGRRDTSAPRVGASLPVEDASSVAAQAARAGIPVATLADAAGLARLCAGPRPEALLCACFPLLLPPALLAWPRHDCLNLHPAPLPAYRGPSPLFWQLRAGADSGELCLHRMVARADAGAVIKRARLDFAPGARVREISCDLAALGVELAAAKLRGDPSTDTPQDEGAASRQGWPRRRDFTFDTGWPVARAYRFVRGIAEWGWPFEVHTSRGVLRIGDAFGYDRAGATPEPAVVMDRRASRVRIALADGVLDARLAMPYDGEAE